MKVGDIVCVKGEQKFPPDGPRVAVARVKKVVPGKGWLVRVVAIQISNGVYTDPVTKLVPLLFEEAF